jgi:hypothetical protein
MRTYLANTAHDFRPRPRCKLVRHPLGFQLQARLQASAWYMPQDHEHWNILGGMTSALSGNRRRASAVLWRPAEVERQFLITPGTWSPGRTLEWGDDGISVLVVPAGELFEADAFFTRYNAFGKNYISYKIKTEKQKQPLIINHDFARPWYEIYRELGPSRHRSAPKKPMSLNRAFAWQ